MADLAAGCFDDSRVTLIMRDVSRAISAAERHSYDAILLDVDNGPDGLPDPSTEVRVPLHRGARFVVDTQRLWHVVVHNGTAPRYALITSFESGPTLEKWIDSQLPARV